MLVWSLEVTVGLPLKSQKSKWEATFFVATWEGEGINERKAAPEVSC